MNTFWKTFFAAILGVLVALFLIFVIGMGIISAVVAASDQPPALRANTVLHIKLDKSIPELTNNLEPSSFSLNTEKTLGLHEITGTIEQAVKNDKIKGIFLEVDMVNAPFTTVGTLRESLLKFKESGKFIVAYSDYYTQQGYYLSSAADDLYVNPIGLIDIRGFSATIPFYTNLFEKIGLHMNVFYAGKFKSATEPFRRTSMSPENKLQTRSYLTELYDHMVANIASSRGLEEEKLLALINQFDGLFPEKTLEAGLVDGIITKGEAIEKLKERLGLKASEKFPLMSLVDFNRVDPPRKNYSAKNRIAVVYAEGNIVGGKGKDGSVGDQKYVRLIREIKANSSIKAIVLRVNSPGGSALASENILRELKEVQTQNNTPVIVSMGDYAASGGYYIACQADSIFAEPTTITGSIGVFSVFPDISKMTNDKIGVNFDTVNTALMASAFTPFFEMSADEVKLMNVRTEKMYQTFLDRVAAGRNMTKDDVHQIAQGRVWTGKQALEHKLVDRLGGLPTAIDAAAALAGLEEGEYRISSYPYVKDPYLKLIEDLTGVESSVRLQQRFLKEELGPFYPAYRQFKELSAGGTAVQAKLPVVINF